MVRLFLLCMRIHVSPAQTQILLQVARRSSCSSTSTRSLSSSPFSLTLVSSPLRTSAIRYACIALTLRERSLQLAAPTVVRCCIHRTRSRRIHMHTAQRLCRLPVRRRRNAALALGASAFPPPRPRTDPRSPSSSASRYSSRSACPSSSRSRRSRRGSGRAKGQDRTGRFDVPCPQSGLGCCG